MSPSTDCSTCVRKNIVCAPVEGSMACNSCHKAKVKCSLVARRAAVALSPYPSTSALIDAVGKSVSLAQMAAAAHDGGVPDTLQRAYERFLHTYPDYATWANAASGTPNRTPAQQ
ncbi:hypothetical protein CYLTODRAFT_479706 [Cylindrobasidium torrendii FP15055 ss-10]|uniref:Zn(2)-C6 fungal-type domain-containing protein n=1 Tax=Cylindrobasidium torrendii FP15055 ss-10 TaxID=1314674 RepID=A0A0D7AT77_9AGAR|nr:hypothetical protein CYLTODRAFT_479706 [Cylindrobasidium torrendii FP15055 ss-10]